MEIATGFPASPIDASAGSFGPYCSINVPSLALYDLAGHSAVFIHDAYVLLAARLVLGITAATVVSASIATISARYEEPMRMRMIGFQGGLGAAVGLVTLWSAGQLAAAGTWRSPFSLYLPGFVLFGLALFGFRDSDDPLRGRSEHHSSLGKLLSQWRLYAVTIVLFGATFTTALQLSFKLGEHGIADPRAQSYVILPSVLLNAVASAANGFVVTWIGDYITFVLLIALMAVGAGLIGIGQTAVTVAIGASLMGIGGGLLGPNLIGKLVVRTDESHRAEAVGLLYSCIFIGQFLNPFFMQPLREAFKTDDAFLILGGFLGVFMALAAITMRPRAPIRSSPIGGPWQRQYTHSPDHLTSCPAEIGPASGLSRTGQEHRPDAPAAANNCTTWSTGFLSVEIILGRFLRPHRVRN